MDKDLEKDKKRSRDYIVECPAKDTLVTLWKECFDKTKDRFSKGNIESQGSFFRNVEFYLTDFDQHFFFQLHPEDGTIDFLWEKPEGDIDMKFSMDAEILHLISLERLAPLVAIDNERLTLYRKNDFEFIRVIRFFFLFKPLYKEYRLALDYDVEIF